MRSRLLVFNILICSFCHGDTIAQYSKQLHDFEYKTAGIQPAARFLIGFTYPAAVRANILALA